MESLHITLNLNRFHSLRCTIVYCFLWGFSPILFFCEMTFNRTIKELNSWSVFKIGSYESKGVVETVKD